MRQQFGGSWTEKKLSALQDYLNAYMTIMRKNQKARNFKTIYLDGFAGSGKRYGRQDTADQAVFEDFRENEVVEFYAGSPYRALKIEKPFDEYIFVDIDQEAAEELKQLQTDFPDRNIRIEVADSNEFIPEWCSALRPLDRALVFLDPYGMQVDWKTIEALASTQKVDLWVLVPLGQAPVRLLCQRPPEAWAATLTRFFGTEEWREYFYKIRLDETLFGIDETMEREVDFEKVTEYFIKRLRTVFVDALEDPVVLRNSKGNPLYLLCFAVSNPKGAQPAIKIAKDIARKFNDGR